MKLSRTTSLAALVAVPVMAAAGVLAVLSSSLPRRDGQAHVPELTKPVRVELDEHAIARLRGETFEDVLSAQGFVHAQERFFQMDLMRRASAGELAALAGARALAADRAQRPFELRRRAREWRDRLPAGHRGWLEAYTRGVNAGLEDLGAAPPEYLVLGERPAAWTIEDSLLVVYTVYTMLSNNERYEKAQAVMEATLPPALYEFLTPSTSRLDRPVVFSAGDRTGGYAPLPIPPAHVVDLRERAPPAAPRGIVSPPLSGPASNQWALGAARTIRGDALLANDPHLELRIPNIFFRAELHWPDHAVRGVSIPGVPGILIGASGAVAWGATVSNADQSDWIVVDAEAGNGARYRTGEGAEPFGEAAYDIAVAGAGADRLVVRTTRWGPVVDTDGLGRPLVLEATWLSPDGVDLDFLDMMHAGSVAEALDVVSRWHGPSLNWMVADSAGAVGWAVSGPVPRRIGFDGSVPRPRTGGQRWAGTVTLPRRGPVTGELFTANSRTLPREQALELSRMWMRPLRAKRIEELLAAEPRHDERHALAMQLDTRAAGYDFVRDIVLEIVPADERDARLRWARTVAVGWNGNADADGAAFALMHAYYRVLLERVLAPLLAPALAADPTFVYRWPLADEPLRRVLEERPAHLLSAGHATWHAFLRDALTDTVERLERGPGGLAQSWGEANALDVAHPLAALPILGRWMRLPGHEQPGSMVSLRVATPGYGAVIRMAVSPAHPEAGYLQMTGGQSGHFLSRNFDDLHMDWARGAPTPFLAGPTVAEFTLTPPPIARSNRHYP